MSIKKGEPWGRPASGPPDAEVAGSDRDLARAVALAPGALVRFTPDTTSDLARAVGLGEPEAQNATDVPVDALSFGKGSLAVNMIVLGAPPDRLGRLARAVRVHVTVDGSEWVHDRATTVVCATGQFLRGSDLVPRGHPGDGRAEVQVYQLRASERAQMRRRLPAGEHLPHPRILHRTARRLEVVADAPMALEADGEPLTAVSRLVVDVVPGAYRLLL